MPAKTIVVSYSEIDTYRQCPIKHQLSYKERWTRPAREGGALERGTLWHAVLEAHYRVLQAQQLPGRDPGFKISDDELAKRCADATHPLLLHPDSAEPLSESAELVTWMYQGYLDQFGFDPNWKILAVEHSAQVPILGPLGQRTRYRLKVKIDLIVRDLSLGNRMWVVDHKSGKDLPAQKALELDDQFGLYTLGMQRLGKPVFGQVYNAARTQRNKTGVQTLESRFCRYPLYRDEPELRAIELDAYQTCVSAYGPRPVALRDLPDPGSAPNPETCKWKCDFLESHLMARKTAGGFDQQSLMLRQYLKDYGFEIDLTRH